MESRIKLHEELVDLLGSSNVYYQPPPSKEINYPAIIYKRANIDNDYASNRVYSRNNVYDVVVIDSDPDSTLVYKVADMGTAKHLSHYTANNLNHDVFRISWNKK